MDRTGHRKMRGADSGEPAAVLRRDDAKLGKVGLIARGIAGQERMAGDGGMGADVKGRQRRALRATATTMPVRILPRRPGLSRRSSVASVQLHNTLNACVHLFSRKPGMHQSLSLIHI